MKVAVIIMFSLVLGPLSCCGTGNSNARTNVNQTDAPPTVIFDQRKIDYVNERERLLGEIINGLVEEDAREFDESLPEQDRDEARIHKRG